MTAIGDETAETARIGFVGLGVMGGGIARRLLDAGHQLVGWNRTKEKATPLLAGRDGLVRHAA